jgi:phenylacetate-CoA ligase
LYMSSYHLAPQYLSHYVRVLRDFRADYIEGYPSSVYAIAQYILESNLAPIPFKACFTTAETLFDFQRQAIGQAFGCKTFNQYGCGEMAVFAAECECGNMHLSPEIGIVDVVDDDNQPVESGQVGHLICTSLINEVQPFIRYRIGDLGSLQPGGCPCGRPLPLLGRIEGRADDVLITRDGRRIGRLDPVFKISRGILEAQIVQDDYENFRVRIVPGVHYTDADGQDIVESLSLRLGKATICIELVPQIERTRAGKFKAVLSNLPENQK